MAEQVLFVDGQWVVAEQDGMGKSVPDQAEMEFARSLVRSAVHLAVARSLAEQRASLREAGWPISAEVLIVHLMLNPSRGQLRLGW